ncbi:hypothetical protein BD309DRAFT_876619 [Dichomitus squalens]|nr:hypothetical protein BD309DRAFT_876619 [Dichomitus squalens]
MSTITVTIPTDLGSIAAPVLLGALLNWALYGVLSVQVYLYYLSFPKDGWIPRCLVYGIWTLDTVQTIIVTNDVYIAYAKRYGQLEVLGAMQNEWLAVPVFSGVVSCTVQLYYAYRIGILSRSRTLQGVISVLALTQGTAAIVTGAQAKIIGSFAGLQQKAAVSCGLWLSGSALCDIIIASFMAYLLLRNDVRSAQTHAIINRLVRLVVETGTLTAVAATIDIVLYFSEPDTDYHSCIATILAKLYSNSLLVIFNSRIRIVGGRINPSASVVVGFPRSGWPSTTSQTEVGPPMEYKVHTTTYTTTLGDAQPEDHRWSDAIQLEEQHPGPSDFPGKGKHASE